jgi:hypothetical protein
LDDLSTLGSKEKTTANPTGETQQTAAAATGRKTTADPTGKTQQTAAAATGRKTTADLTGHNATERTAAAATGLEGRKTTADPTGHVTTERTTAAATGTCLEGRTELYVTRSILRPPHFKRFGQVKVRFKLNSHRDGGFYKRVQFHSSSNGLGRGSNPNYDRIGGGDGRKESDIERYHGESQIYGLSRRLHTRSPSPRRRSPSLGPRRYGAQWNNQDRRHKDGGMESGRERDAACDRHRSGARKTRSKASEEIYATIAAKKRKAEYTLQIYDPREPRCYRKGRKMVRASFWDEAIRRSTAMATSLGHYQGLQGP